MANLVSNGNSTKGKEPLFLGCMADVVVAMSDSSVSSMECSVESSESKIEVIEERQDAEEEMVFPETLFSRPVPLEDNTINRDDDIDRVNVTSSVSNSCISPSDSTSVSTARNVQLVVADKASISDQCGVASTTCFQAPHTVGSNYHIISLSLTNKEKKKDKCTALQRLANAANLLLKGSTEERTLEQTAVLFLCLFGILLAVGQSVFQMLVPFVMRQNFNEDRATSSSGKEEDCNSSIPQKDHANVVAALSSTQCDVFKALDLCSHTNPEMDQNALISTDDTASAQHNLQHKNYYNHEDTPSIASHPDSESMEQSTHISAVSQKDLPLELKSDETMMSHDNLQDFLEGSNLNTEMSGPLQPDTESVDFEQDYTLSREDKPLDLLSTVSIVKEDKLQEDSEDNQLNAEVVFAPLHFDSESVEQVEHDDAVSHEDKPLDLQSNVTMVEEDRLQDDIDGTQLNTEVVTAPSHFDLVSVATAVSSEVKPLDLQSDAMNMEQDNVCDHKDMPVNSEIFSPSNSDSESVELVDEASVVSYKDKPLDLQSKVTIMEQDNPKASQRATTSVDGASESPNLRSAPTEVDDSIKSTGSSISVPDKDSVPLDLTACVVWKGRSENDIKTSLLVGKLFCYEKVGFNSFAVCPSDCVSQAT